jgi:stress response protein YsnF
VHVTITRIPMERVVDRPIPVREEEGTTILSVVEEVLVVEKRWMLREDIHIRQERRETHQPQRITLRSEEVQITCVPHADDTLSTARRNYAASSAGCVVPNFAISFVFVYVHWIGFGGRLRSTK